jgi:hypothetical protein
LSDWLTVATLGLGCMSPSLPSATRTRSFVVVRRAF